MRFLIFLLLLSSCCAGTDKAPQNRTAAVYVTNPLDSILGEKVLSENPFTIRPDNFNDLIGMPASLLSDTCALYDIERLDSTTWIMEQQGHYHKTRKFALIVKTDGKKIIRYKPLNDFGIGNCLSVPDGFVFVSGIVELVPFPGVQYDHYIRVFKTDKDLNDVWNYAPQSAQSALIATGLSKKGERYVIPVRVIDGSTIVYHTVAVEIDDRGNYISGTETGRSNCHDTLSPAAIDFIFTNRQ